MKFSFGLNCKDNKTQLTEIDVETLYEQIISTTQADLISYTKNLRSVLKYSVERYRTMKTGLPFFSCSLFIPSYRSIRNFVSASGLILDIDLKRPIPQSMIDDFKSDPTIVLGYISPSNMGIKLIFCFDQPINESDTYTAVYKHFSYIFSERYHLSDSIDQKNCDVSRICFICNDINAWYNQDYIPIDWQSFGLETSIIKDKVAGAELSKSDIAPSAYNQILKLLDTKPKRIKADIPLMPEIALLIPDITMELSGYAIQIKSTENIQYGIKIKVFKEQQHHRLGH